MRRSLIAISVCLFVALGVQAVPPGTNDEITARLVPFGDVCRAGQDCGVAAAAVARGPLSGEQVYQQFCFACHATGVSDAPIYGDKDAWALRVAKGMDVLMASTLDGLNAMPAKGTCMDCSDDELSQAVDYMLENAQ